MSTPDDWRIRGLVGAFYEDFKIYDQMNFNYLPIPLNPLLMKSTSPDKIIYTEPRLAPDGAATAPTAAAPTRTPTISESLTSFTATTSLVGLSVA